MYAAIAIVAVIIAAAWYFRRGLRRSLRRRGLRRSRDGFEPESWVARANFTPTPHTPRPRNDLMGVPSRITDDL